jgi:hypothetical protein
LIFNCEIKNNSDSTILVSPETFRMDIYQTIQLVPTKQKIEKSSLFAFNPEQEILAIDKALARERASYANTLILQTTSDVLQIASEISTAPKTEEALEKRNNYWENSHIQSANTESSHLARSYYLNQRKIDWKLDPIRKTTLRPGESIRGLVLFPTNHKQRNSNLQTKIQLTFPLGRIELHYNYTQTVHVP